ncbi:DUF6465 family protein [uncultured Robinsoniella sp.]|uniref:DUF6465 family protein n=1 Tax=uncultured Robinsoniella sp. TaxID=904190 RepID=UPI00374F81B4
MAKKRHLKKKNKMMTGNVIENETREEIGKVSGIKTKEAAVAAEQTKEVQADAVKKEVAEAKKRTSKKMNFYVQFQDAEYNEQDIIAQVKKLWKDAGNRIADLNTMDIYVKPEEKMVYYTINEELSASFAL